MVIFHTPLDRTWPFRGGFTARASEGYWRLLRLAEFDSGA
jgi:hypothetical protein